MITLIVPTCNRPGKVLRLLQYLTSTFAYYSAFPVGVDASSSRHLTKIIVADGTEIDRTHERTYSLLDSQLSVLKNFISVEYHYLPGQSLVDRWLFLSSRVSTPFVMPIGDDDLPILSGFGPALRTFQAHPNASAVAGRLLNIRGLNTTSLNICIGERPYSNIALDHSCILSKITQFYVLNMLGIPALFYSLQPASILRQFWSLLQSNQSGLFYGGQEFLHQNFLCISGDIFFIDDALVLRDFTYWGYVREAIREAPETDVYPYYGEKAIHMIADLIHARDPLLTIDCIKDFLDGLLRLGPSLSASRKVFDDPKISEIITSKYIPCVDRRTLRRAYVAWRTTLGYCYNAED